MRLETKLLKLYTEKYKDFEKFLYNTLNAGKTPLDILAENEISPTKILLKREDLEPTGSIKVRTAAGMHFLLREKLLEKKSYITIASSGNFAKDLPYIVKKDKLNFPIKAFISEKIYEENPDIVKKIDAEIVPVDDGYCPVNKRKRGKAITFAQIEEEVFKAVFYNQYESIGNPFGNLSLGIEIAKQLRDMGIRDDPYIVVGIGTGGSALGLYYGYKFCTGHDPKLIVAMPEDNHHQLGLRSYSEQGNSVFFAEIKKLAKEFVIVSDKEAFLTMENLWQKGIPAGISTGTNVYASKVISERIDSIVVTLMPDSIANMNYFEFLKKFFEPITGKQFNVELYNMYQTGKIAANPK